MARRKKVDTSQLGLSLFSPEDFLEKVETALQEAPSPIEPTKEEEDTFDRERLILEMRTADDFLQTLIRFKVPSFIPHLIVQNDSFDLVIGRRFIVSRR